MTRINDQLEAIGAPEESWSSLKDYIETGSWEIADTFREDDNQTIPYVERCAVITAVDELREDFVQGNYINLEAYDQRMQMRSQGTEILGGSDPTQN